MSGAGKDQPGMAERRGCARADPVGRNGRGLRALGVVLHDVPLSRAGLNPAQELRAFATMVGLMRRLRPDRVLSYAIKPMIWARLPPGPPACPPLRAGHGP